MEEAALPSYFFLLSKVLLLLGPIMNLVTGMKLVYPFLDFTHLASDLIIMGQHPYMVDEMSCSKIIYFAMKYFDLYKSYNITD
jgi:hypothetical protein